MTPETLSPESMPMFCNCLYICEKIRRLIGKNSRTNAIDTYRIATVVLCELLGTEIIAALIAVYSIGDDISVPA